MLILVRIISCRGALLIWTLTSIISAAATALRWTRTYTEASFALEHVQILAINVSIVSIWARAPLTLMTLIV